MCYVMLSGKTFKVLMTKINLKKQRKCIERLIYMNSKGQVLC